MNYCGYGQLISHTTGKKELVYLPSTRKYFCIFPSKIISFFGFLSASKNTFIFFYRKLTYFDLVFPQVTIFLPAETKNIFLHGETKHISFVWENRLRY